MATYYTLGILPDVGQKISVRLGHVEDWAKDQKCVLTIDAGDSSLLHIHLTHTQLRDLRNAIALAIVTELPPASREAQVPAEIAGTPV